jgi:hypothetical protein
MGNNTHQFAKQSPSSWWYALAVLPFIAGFALGIGYFVWSLFQGFAQLDKELVQVVVPGSATLNFDRPGTKTIFMESHSVVRGRVYATNGTIEGLACHVFASANHSEVPIRQTSTASSYTLNGRSGTSIEEFRIDRAGSYWFQCGYDSGRDGPEVVLAVGAFDLDWAFKPMPLMFVSFGGGALIGAPIFLIIYRMQRRNLIAALERGRSPQPLL